MDSESLIWVVEDRVRLEFAALCVLYICVCVLTGDCGGSTLCRRVRTILFQTYTGQSLVKLIFRDYAGRETRLTELWTVTHDFGTTCIFYFPHAQFPLHLYCLACVFNLMIYMENQIGSITLILLRSLWMVLLFKKSLNTFYTNKGTQ